MKMRTFMIFVLTAIMLLCCSCAPSASEQQSDVWAYKKAADGPWTEENRRNYLEVMYLYENLRPDEGLTDTQLASSQDEQLLRLIDERYKDLGEEAYMPREGELQYADMKKIVPPMIESLNLADKAPDMCFSYYRGLGLSASNSQWITLIVYEDGYDYRLYIDANDGSFQKWERYPQGYWANLNMQELPANEPTDTSNEPLRTDDELINVATAYAESALVSGEARIVETSTTEINASPNIKKDVRVYMHPNNVYQISVDYNDLSITSVESKGY